MTANESTGSAGKNPADSIDTTRRLFLGAAAAVAGLAATDTATADPKRETDVSTNDQGEGIARVESGAPVWGSLDLYGAVDESTTLGVSADWFADEPPSVNVSLRADVAEVTMGMSPERARELASELRLAATHAEQGAREAGWSE